ncbi:MAG: polyprenol phosphomannose-dependent alpha 1,6 mannosyltransferase MptB [Actinobacteria bacterium]|nr:polyprenol phosphomannose-dependent alpha 1,6 mannosyltransferase MptB [Actinomycetota bacterium]
MRRGAVLGLGALVAGCVGLIVLAAEQATESTSSPLEPEGAWRSLLIVAGVVSFLAYVAAALALKRSRSPLTVVVVIAVVVQLLPLLGPVLLSRDVYAYWAYGRIGAVHNGNPYSDVPATFPEDPAVRRMGTSWLETTTIYGPVWTLVAEGVSETADSARAATYAFSAIAAASMLAIVALVALIARNRPFAVAFVGWNPLLALHFAGGGHNDALMMALALGALTFGLRRRPGAAGLAWIASLAVKWVAAAFAGRPRPARRPLPRAATARRHGRRRHGDRRDRVFALRLCVARRRIGSLDSGPTDGLDRAFRMARRPRSRASPDPRCHRGRDARGCGVARVAGVARPRPARTRGRAPGSAPGMAQPVVRGLGSVAGRAGGGHRGAHRRHAPYRSPTSRRPPL